MSTHNIGSGTKLSREAIKLNKQNLPCKPPDSVTEAKVVAEEKAWSWGDFGVVTKEVNSKDDLVKYLTPFLLLKLLLLIILALLLKMLQRWLA